MNLIFVIGMAGAGKSLLTGSLCDWFRLRGVDALTVNLDPGAASIPYNPDIDVRSSVNVNHIMEEYQLGPNGALLMAADLIADKLDELTSAIEESGPELLIIDTPGQIELFAFRESGPFIADNLPGESKAVIYLLDAPFSRNPLNFVSNIFLAASIYHRLLKPQVYALSKCDMIGEDEVNRIVEWTQDPNLLSQDLEKRVQIQAIVMRELAENLERIGLITEPIPISSTDMGGFIDLSAAITRITSRGEEDTI